MDQAPPAVTQTINRVVERTIESVVPEDGEAKAGEVVTKEVIKEVQVVVRESDLVSDAVAKVGKSVVRVYTLNTQVDRQSIEGTFLGMGFVISRDGLIVTDSSFIEPGRTYAVKTGDNSLYEVRVKNESATRSTAVLEVSTGSKEVVFPPVAFSDLSVLELPHLKHRYRPLLRRDQ